MPRFAQVKENLPVRIRDLPDDLLAEVQSLNRDLDGDARVLVRPSGTEPVVRVLAEAENEQEAALLCARVTALVRRELG
jgi:phosphoglucosamine mutase